MLQFKQVQKYQTFFIDAYLVIYSIWLIVFFLNTTMFQIKYPDFAGFVLLEVTIIIVMIRIIMFNKLSKAELWFFTFLIISFVGSFIYSGYVFLLPVLFIILGSKNIPFKKLLQIYCTISGVLIVLTVIASHIGLVENLIYERNGQRISFGFIYPTDFTAHIFFFVMGYCYLRKNRLSYLELIGILGLSIFSYVFCDARTNTTCLILTFVVILYLKICNRISKKRDNESNVNPITCKILVFSMPICALFMILMTFLYYKLPDSNISIAMNRFVNNRLYLSSMGLERYGVNLFGSAFQMFGFGGSTTPPESYFYLDSSYLLILIRYGLLVFLSVMAIFVKSSIAAKNQNDITLLLILSIISLQCMIEHHLLDIAYNPFIFMIFSQNYRS